MRAPTKQDLRTMWETLGVFALGGHMSLAEVGRLTALLVVWSALVRNGGNKSHAAASLGTTRKFVRERMAQIEDGTLSEYARSIFKHLIEPKPSTTEGEPRVGD